MGPEKSRRIRRILFLLHRRDRAFGFLPAVNRGPPKGILDAASRAIADSSPLPDMRQLPPNVYYAARAAQLLVEHPLTHGQLDDWIRKNALAAVGMADKQLSDWLPFTGCFSHEDVRNRILVGIEELTLAELEHFEGAVLRLNGELASS